MPRAGPLRYWLLTLVGIVLVLASVAAVVWGTYNLIGTESCGTRTTEECSSETGLHILAVVVGPLVGGFGAVLLAFRGGTMWSFKRERRVADMVARGEVSAPVVQRPSFSVPPPPDLPTPGRGPIERLQQLDEMKAKGLITVADYESQKKRILGGT